MYCSHILLNGNNSIIFFQVFQLNVSSLEYLIFVSRKFARRMVFLETLCIRNNVKGIY